jgi:hypothetical protein
MANISLLNALNPRPEKITNLVTNKRPKVLGFCILFIFIANVSFNVRVTIFTISLQHGYSTGSSY